MGATRLPGKMALELYPGLPALGAVIERVKAAKQVDQVIVATSNKERDDEIEAIARTHGVDAFRGSEDDVLGRVIGAGEHGGADALVLVTGDCSCISPSVIDEGVSLFFSEGCDFLSNCLEDTFPQGIDAQVVSLEALKKAHDLASAEPHCQDSNNFEHANFFMRNHPELFSIYTYRAPQKYHRPDIELLLDTPQDLVVIRNIYERLHGRGKLFDVDDILELIDREPDILKDIIGLTVNRVGYTL